jgi:hypothetical protein
MLWGPVGGQVLVKPPTQACWSRNLSELLLLCNEAAARNAKRHPEDMEKKKDADGTQTKPLGLEYISDRIETDDPIWGYMVRPLNPAERAARHRADSVRCRCGPHAKAGCRASSH